MLEYEFLNPKVCVTTVSLKNWRNIAVQRFSSENLKDKVVPIKNGALKISRNNKMSILVLNTPSKISIVS